MAKNTKSETKVEDTNEKRTRIILSPAERIAKLQAEAERIAAVEKSKAVKQLDGAAEEIEKLNVRITDLTSKRDAKIRDYDVLAQQAGTHVYAQRQLDGTQLAEPEVEESAE